MSTGGPGDQSLRRATRLVRAGRSVDLSCRGVNPVVQRASTLLVDDAADLFAPGVRTYGIHGTITHEALKDALRVLEEAPHCFLVSSGLLACTVPILALAEAGAHILVTDNVYGPTRRFCDQTVRRWGGTVEYFDPHIGADIGRLFRDETRLVFLESPGSLTFEIGDTPAIAGAARASGIATVFDNTWGAGVHHKPLDLGVDISVQATSKYAGGGADLLGGSILTRNDAFAARIKETIADLGLSVAPDEAYLILRGLRTLETRLAHHERAGLQVAEWLERQPEVQRVLHPALGSHPDHALWRRDFTGAAGLFGVVLRPASQPRVNQFLNALCLFGLGFSWGGFESLAIPCDPQLKRTAPRQGGGARDLGGPLIRLSIGLEDCDDLIHDLEQALKVLDN